jgi:hypothetical protein
MTTICVILNLKDFDTILRLDDALIMFPCFIKADPLGSGMYEVSIECRQEDAAAIETMLAPYV